ncbi:membrane protein insertase YidC [Thiomicrolovo sp. ZZH C-3]
MFEKMSPNQRLILAVVLSFVFFIVYTAIFPPEMPESAEQNVTLTERVGAEAATPAVADGGVGHAVAASEKVANPDATKLVTVESSEFTLKIDTLGRIVSKVLKDEKYYVDDKPTELIAQEGAQPLFIRFADEAVNAEALKVPYRADTSTLTLDTAGTKTLTLTQTLSQLTVTKTLTFYADGHYDIKVSLSKPMRYFLYVGQHAEHKGQMMMAVHGVMAYTADGVSNIFEDGDVEGRTALRDVQLLSAFDQYFASIFYGFDPELIINVDRDRSDNPIAYIEASDSLSFNGFIGPKDYRLLESINPVLVNAIEYGWFTWAAKPLFSFLLFLHGIFGNWGWAIVVLVIAIRLVLYPLTYKGMVSMQKMKDLAPKMKELREKYKGDPQRMNAAVMELYKKNGANPMGGCLPLLLQIPVFFAIYRVLLNAVELQGAPWMFWIDDLSRMDPTYILPILMGASMYFQQKMTPNNFTDPMQEKIFKYLPVVFTFFFVTFPSGLVLYWLTNNLLSIAQQYMVNKQYAKIKAARHEAHLAQKEHHGDEA